MNERAQLVAGDLACVVDSLLTLPAEDWPRLRRALDRAERARVAAACRRLLETLPARERRQP